MIFHRMDGQFDAMSCPPFWLVSPRAMDHWPIFQGRHAFGDAGTWVYTAFGVSAPTVSTKPYPSARDCILLPSFFLLFTSFPASRIYLRERA
jgi:hypothetical protein